MVLELNPPSLPLYGSALHVSYRSGLVCWVTNYASFSLRRYWRKWPPDWPARWMTSLSKWWKMIGPCPACQWVLPNFRVHPPPSPRSHQPTPTVMVAELLQFIPLVMVGELPPSTHTHIHTHTHKRHPHRKYIIHTPPPCIHLSRSYRPHTLVPDLYNITNVIFFHK